MARIGAAIAHVGRVQMEDLYRCVRTRRSHRRHLLSDADAQAGRLSGTFECRGYDTIAADLDGAWLQKRFWPCGVKACLMDCVH